MKIMRMILTGFVFVAIFISVNTVVANTEDYIADISTSYGSQETMSNDLAIALIQNEPEERFSLSSHLRYLYPLMKLERIWKGIITNPLEEINILSIDQSQSSCNGVFPDPQINVYDCINPTCKSGNCTWWAAYRRDDVGDVGWGNAYEWESNAEINGYAVCSVAKFGANCPILKGAIAWWTTGIDKGHVAYVENNNPLEVSEMSCPSPAEPNYPSNDPKVWVHWGGYGYRVLTSEPNGYIYGFKDDPVALFEKPGFFIGNKFRFETPMSLYNLPDSLNDRVSSIRIQYPWAVKVYEDANGGGGCLVLDSDDLDLSDNKFNNGQLVDDKISSISVFYAACPLPCPNLSSNSNDENLTANKAIVTNLGYAGIGICENPIPPKKDSASFVSDITLPDGTVVSPGQSLVKTWRMRNTGSSTWGSGYQLAFVSGEQMGAPNAVNVPATAPGQTADISVPLTAPSVGGSHRGNWQMRNPQGTYFGDQVWVKINVLSDITGSGHITNFDVSPASPSSATVVHIVGRFKAFPDYRSARFVIGTNSIEQPNIQLIGDQYQISTDWQTGSLPRGNYAIAFEVASTGDLNWSSPERQVKNYTLTGTPVSTNHSPDRPILSSPYNWYLKDASGSPAAVTLCVNPVTDPDGDPVQYWFEVKDQGGGVYASSGWTSNTCWTNTYAPNTYSWRTKAGDGSAESDWSQDTWNFSVAKGGVYIGDHSFFAQDTNETHLCVFVTYDGIQAPDVYAWINLAADNSESGDWRLLDHYGPNTTPDCTQPNYHGFWIRSPFYETGTHKIKVSAIKRDSGANATMMTSLNISYIRPPEPNPLAPSSPNNNGTWWNTRTINFQWSPSLRAESYTLRASTNSDPWADPSPVLNQVLSSGTTSYAYTFSQDYGQLYWSVKASNSAGFADTGGNIWFGIDQVKPSCQVQTLPSVTYENVFQVNWSGTDNSAGVRSYNIQYLDSTRDAWNDWLLNAPASKPYELFTGKPGHTYYFQCQATDMAGNMGDYPVNADTFTKVDPAARPPAPWWDLAWTGKRNLTILNNMPGMDLPVSYPVHLHFDSGTSPTAADIYAASQSTPKCNDLRIVYNDTTELDRVVDRCDATAIDFWFRTQVSIPGGTSNNTSHQLYYGNASAGSPPEDPNHVWYPYLESDTQYLYFFQEGSGSVAYDSSGHGRNCSINSSVQWAPALFGNGLQFNHANSGDSRSLNCGSATPLSSFTIEFWLKPDPAGSGKIAGELAGGGNGGGGNNWALSLFEGHIRFDTWPCPACGSSEVRSNFSLFDSGYVNWWNHIAVSFNGGNEVRFYLNGNLDSTKYLSQSGINTFSPPLEIGSVEGINQIKAGMGTFRISSGVKTSFPYGSFITISNKPTLAVGSVVNPPIVGQADLAIISLVSYPNPGGGYLVEAIVQNQGDLDTQNGFYTDLYVDHLPTGSGDYTGSLQFWVNDPIAAGATVTLTTVLTELPGLGAHALSPASETTGTLYAQVDSTGAVGELDNDNNIYAAGTEICVATADAYESDDTAATASTIGVGETQTHNFDGPGDRDWAKFRAEAGQSYLLTTADLGASSDTYLYLYDTDGVTLLASNDDYGGTLASQIEWIAPTTGTYYVLVQHWNPNAGGCGTRYNLAIGEPSLYLYLPLVQR